MRIAPTTTRATTATTMVSRLLCSQVSAWVAVGPPTRAVPPPWAAASRAVVRSSRTCSSASLEYGSPSRITWKASSLPSSAVPVGKAAATPGASFRTPVIMPVTNSGGASSVLMSTVVGASAPLGKCFSMSANPSLDGMLVRKSSVKLKRGL